MKLNSRTFQGLLKESLRVFKDYKRITTTDLHVEILLQKYKTEIIQKLTLKAPPIICSRRPLKIFADFLKKTNKA